MTTYIFFDDALQMLVKAFLMSVILLIAASGTGLAIIETMEKTDILVGASLARRPQEKRVPGG